MSDFLNVVVKSFSMTVKPYKGLEALIGLVYEVGVWGWYIGLVIPLFIRKSYMHPLNVYFLKFKQWIL